MPSTPSPPGQDPRHHRGRRQGPRPLPLHLTAATLAWTSSLAVLPLWRSGSLGWRPELESAAETLAAEAARANPDDLAVAVAGEARRRLAAFLDGLTAYRRHAYRRELAAPPVLWQEGTTRLLDYGGPGSDPGGCSAPAVLAVPSLINRAYILDLAAERSFLRFLKQAGFRPLLVDWGAPGEIERGFGLDDYVTGRLGRALDAALAAAGAPPILIGYCMGGLLALGLAQQRERDLAGLALLATPWDFHAERAEQARMLGAMLPALEPLLAALGELPVDVIQALFAALDPSLALRKFLDFAKLDPTSPRAQQFVALEDWLNDGVAMSAPVARECLGGWYGRNTTANGRWRLAERPVAPQRLGLACLAVIPGQDRIVPPLSALALARALPNCETWRPALGHIGMMAGGKAEGDLWRPLTAWLSCRVRARPVLSAGKPVRKPRRRKQ
jgi:polyhydroxyalkanoate synthase subunit PhaC